jgi:uroporphyrinogen-III synthase
VPAIRLVPIVENSALRSAIRNLSSYAWIIFTSAHAVDFFWWQVVEDSSIQNWPKIAAVGPATQKALQAHSLTVQAMPEEYLGSAIAATLGDIQGAHILLPRSAMGGRELPASLAELGAIVDDIALYEPAPAPINETARTTLTAGVDVVTFASGSAVRAFVNALRGDARFANFWSNVTVACIGPTTAEVARSEGLPVHLVADEHSVQGMIAALVAYFEQGA